MWLQIFPTIVKRKGRKGKEKKYIYCFLMSVGRLIAFFDDELTIEITIIDFTLILKIKKGE